MCGIVGVIGQIDLELTKAFALLLEIDVVRGRDSTGIVCVDSAGDVDYAKEAWLPTDLLNSNKGIELLKTTQKRMLIGHNRHATVGKVNKAGAHPFEFENVIGVHNGTTPKHKFKDHAQFSVDSEALYNHVDKEGIEDMWENMSGAASLAFYSKTTKKFHLLRNDQRPMYVAFTKDNNAIIFASEPWMIQAAVYKTKVELDVERGIAPTAINTLYSFDPYKWGSLTKFSKKEIKEYETPPVIKQKPVLNTWAKDYYDLKYNHEIRFTIVSVEEGARGMVTCHLESKTKTPLKGRMFLYANTDAADIKEVKESIVSGDEWRGDIASYTTYGINQGFVISSRSAYNESELEREFEEMCAERDAKDADVEDGIVIETVGDIITRDMFKKSATLDCDCQFCGNPLDYDNPATFKYAGILNGRKSFMCEDCEEDLNDLLVGTTLRPVHKVSDLTS